ncbi:MAG: hypothetical protein KGL38_04580 [Gemmatimonadota bacterium]|nr:hypothetical protein [Gemmatimonadota bacterium]
MRGTVQGAIWFAAVVVAVGLPAAAQGQGRGQGRGRGGMPGMAMSDSGAMAGMADGAMSGMDDDAMDANMARHMRLTPVWKATAADTARAWALVRELRTALAPYSDTAAARAAGFMEFLPGVKGQKVYHFTNYRNAFVAQFRFDPAKPTSLLYAREADGTMQLVGAMYTAPKGYGEAQLDARVPLGIARWHEHVNWCLPRGGLSGAGLGEKRGGQAVFGPESPIATRAACDAVGGVFHPLLFNWMVHLDVLAGNDLKSIFQIM